MHKHSWGGYIIRCERVNYVWAMNNPDRDFEYLGVCTKGYTLFRKNGKYFAAK